MNSSQSVKLLLRDVVMRIRKTTKKGEVEGGWSRDRLSEIARCFST